MGFERLDIVHEFGKRPLRRWRAGVLNGWNAKHVTIGRLGDGRWYVDVTGQMAYATGDQGEAEALLGRVLARDVWRPVPARFGPDQEPCDGREWRRVGQDWEPAD